MGKQSIIFTEGMDSDTEARLLPPGRYRKARNCIIGTSNTDTVGAVKNEPGNLLQSIVLPSGNNTIIGTAENKQAQSIVYFIHNTSGNHSIFERFSIGGVIEPILTPVAPDFDTLWLNFDVNFRIWDAKVYDGNLIWNDNLNPPRHLRIADARAAIAAAPPTRDIFPYPNLVGLGTTEFREQFIDQIKYPSNKSPDLAYTTDTTRQSNYLRAKLWQFAYRYVYYDFSRSVFSPWSQISKPEDEETALGLVQESNVNNGINITVDTGHPNVRSVEIMFRNGNNGTWFLINDPILKYDVGNNRLIGDFAPFVYSWRGDKQGAAVPSAEHIPLFDAVPLTAKAQEYTTIDRIFHGNYVFGYDNINLDVSMDSFYIPFEFGFITQAWDERSGTAAPGGYFTLDPDPTAVRLCLPTSISDVVEGTKINVAIKLTDVGPINRFEIFNYVVTAADLASLNALATSMANEINNYVGLTAAVVVPARTCVEITIAGTVTLVQFEELDVGQPLTKRTTWKKGAWENFGIVYFDGQGRAGAVNADDNTTIYVPYHPEAVPGQQYQGDTNWGVNLDMTINHLPPPWAKTYQIVWAGSDIAFQLQWVLQVNWEPEVLDEDGFILSDRISLFIPGLTVAVEDEKKKSIQYQWVAGDRIRFITTATGLVLSEMVEVEIFEYDVANDKLIVENFDSDRLLINAGTIFEIYRIRSEVKSEVYEEISEIFDIVGGFHTANQQTQSSGIPAIVRLTRGDTYLYGRDFYLWVYVQKLLPTVHIEKEFKFAYLYSVESMNYSDFYDSEDYDIGRQNAILENARQERFTNGFLHGGKYIQGTQNNDAFKFSLNDAFNVSIEHGEINKLVEIGFTLKVLQERKLTSVYLNRRVTFNSAGTDSLVLTDDIIGDIIPSNDQWGCQHPESAFRKDRHLYFYDARNAAIIRDAANGMIDISSKYYQGARLKEITDLVNASSNYVLGAPDAFHDRVLFNFKLIGNNFVTLSFHEPSNRWKSEHDYNPEYFGWNGNTFVSFVDGALWLHNVNPIACSFYGVKFRQEIEALFNADPISVKIFLSLVINSNKAWEAPNDGDLSIPANDMYTSGMKTRIPESRFKYREGVFYSEIPRDINTPNKFSIEDAVANGRAMRGQVLNIKISNNHDQETVLLDIEGNYNKSERTA